MGKKILLVGTYILFILAGFSSFEVYSQCPASVSLSSDSGNNICAGASVTFTASPNGGSNLSYQWQVNNTNISTGLNFTTTSLNNGDKVKVIVTSPDDPGCSITSSDITMTVNPNRTPTVSLSATPSIKCINENVTFTASNTHGGNSPTFAFYVNSSASPAQNSSSNTFSINSLPEGNNDIRVVMTSSLTCVTSSTAETTISVNISPDSSINSPANKDQPVCINTPLDPVVFVIAGSGNGASVSGLPSGVNGNYSAGNFTISGTPSVSGIFPYTVTTTGPCDQVSESGTITVNKNASISLTSGNNNQEVCQNAAISDINYSIGETGTGATVTGLPSGITGNFSSGVYTIKGASSQAGSHSYSITATGTCGNSTSLTGTIVINQNLDPSVTIASSDADNKICEGTAVTFTATPTNGGTSPSYQWKIGTTNVGTNSSTFTSSNLSDGQSVTVIMSSSETCLTAASATSNAITTTINPNLTPEVTITSSDSDICPGDSVTFTATPVNEGSTPSYQWKIGSTNVGTNSSTFTTTSLTDGQSVSVVLTSNETCLATGTATSNSITTTVQAPPPATPGAITGPQEVCATSTGLVYSVAAVTDAESYAWSFPDAGWSVTGGEGTNSITVNASSTGGNISVAAVNSCGTSSETSLAVTSIGGVPATPGTIAAPNLSTSAICPPATGIEFNVPLVSGADSYIWTLPNGWEITSGSGTNAIIVKVNSTAATTSDAAVSVQAVNICGNSPKSTLSKIAVDSHVITNAGADQTVCKLIAAINIEGTYSFSGTNKNLKPTWSVGTGMGSFGDASRLITTFTPSQAALDAGSVVVTLTTEAPSGACGPGIDDLTIFFKSLPTATITATSPVCSGNTSTLTFTGTPNSRVTYKLPNGTNQTIDIGSSGTATVTTAALTANSTYTLVSSVNLDTPACSNTLSGSATVMITPKPTAEITYSGAPFCTSLTTGQTPTLTGTGAYSDGTYSSTTGLTIDASSGAIIPSTSTPGIYTVTYETPASGGCEEAAATTEITITKEPTATISYAGTPFCTSDSQSKTVTLGGTDNYTGGKFSAPAGLTIDSATGAITPSTSTAGTYTVTYETPSAGGCSPVPATTQVSIAEAPTASISYAGAPFCHSNTSAQAVTLTGTAAFSGGVFTAPTGVSIDASSGAITPASSTPGTYEITYTTPASAGCGEVTTTTNIKITETPAAVISYSGPYCTSDATAHIPAFTNTVGTYQGGAFRSTPDGLSLDPSTGAINATTSSPNTYTVFYELPAGEGCGTSEISTSLTITQVPQLDISYTTPLCTLDTASYPVTFSNVAGAYQGGTFTTTSGLAIDSAGNIIAANSTPGIHTVTYTTPEANGCGSVAMTTNVEIFKEVVITTPPVNVGICSTEPASFEVVASGDNLTYEWKRVDGAAITNATGVNTAKLSFSNATATNAGEYYVQISGSSPCIPVSSEPVTLNVDENIVIIKPTEDITFCDQAREGVTFEYIAHANGAALNFTWIKDGADISNATSDRYSFTTTGPLGDNGEYSGTMTISGPNPADNGVYAVRISGPDYFTCSNANSKTFTLNVTPLPDPPTTEPVVLCQGETAAPLTASGASGATFKWYTSTMEPIEGVPTPSAVNAGSTSYYVTQTTDVCESNPTELVVTVNPTPAVPTTQETLIYCFQEENVQALTATGTDATSVINWYGPNDSTVSLSAAPTPQTTSTGNIKYWVSQSIGDCESELVEIVVTVKPLPELVVTADSQNICEGSSTILHASGANTYVWSLNGTDLGTTADITVTPVAAGSYTYRVTGTDTFGCVNTYEIVIDVEIPSDGGVLTGPSSVCTGENTGTLTLSEHLGEIVRWESSADGTNWTSIAETSETLNFQNLTTATSFRAVVKNGVCDEDLSEITLVTIDQEPVAGNILFNGTDRVFMMCEFPTDDYLVPLQITGTYVGEIVAWQYRRNSATSWSVITNGDGSNFTGTTLTGQQVNSASNNESTLFRVEVQSGACAPNVYSDYATLSVIPSDIAPNPVTAQPGVICIGESISLSAGTGYGGYGTFEGGAFDNSSIANHGWRVMRYPGNTEYTFESAADNVRPDRWMRTNPHDFIMANPNGSGTINQRFDSSSGDEGNKGFAIVSGNNPSTLETPVFNTYTMDNPTLTFDQAYNLTPGDTIKVQISLDGGNTYVDEPLFVVGGPAVSGNYARFGDDGLGEPNNMEIDMSSYAGLGNLRIRWLYDGSTGGIYTIDDIGIPQDPQNVQLVWYYDDDLNDPDNPLEQIGEVNQGTVSYTPTKIGWNYFQVNTALVFDTNGDPCESAENQATIQVYVFDSYTTTATANVGSCGSSEVPLQGTLTGGTQGEITEFPVDDESTIAWTVVSGPDGYTFSENHFTTSSTGPAINDPNAIFNPPLEGNYTLGWTVTADERNTCPIVNGEITFNFVECTTLDFDGIDDYIDLGTNYTGNYFIEAWIRPEASVGTIISGPGFDIKMENLPASIVPNTRWYHIAVSNNGKLWVDGVDSGTTTITGNGANRTIIGARWNANDKTTENHFSGWIEEVRIWNNPPEQREIRFMMNQRLKLDGAGTVTSPLEGEVVPNRSVAGSYLTDGSGNNLHLEGDGTLKPFYDQVLADLAGYYRLISDNPDPAGLINFDPALQPSGGYTPDHAVHKVPGRLYNITTDQENTSPTPYLSGTDGAWADVNTWARPAVWDYPNSSYNGTPLEWNIARINHNIESGSKAITMLGLLSETLDKRLNINPSQFIRISHYLLLDGNMDLQDESQLLQDHGSILANESQGWAEIDQQGRMSSFNYNYWTSPASNQGSDNNSGFMLNQVLLDGTTPANPQPINFQNGYYVADGAKTSPITISTSWIWDFRGGTADLYGDWTHLGSDYTEIVGAGFSMKGTDGTVAPNTQTQNYVFRGKPNNGNIPTTELYLTSDKNYLVGNPYPSAIDADKFLRDNLVNVASGTGDNENGENVFNGTLYYWDHFAGSTHILEEYIGGYATYTLAGAAPAISNDWRIDDSDPNLSGGKLPQRYIPVAQGFFLNSAPVGTTTFGGKIIFKNTQRIYKKESTDPSIFLQHEGEPIKGQALKNPEDKREKIRLKFESPKGYHRQILVTRDENTTNGFDIGYDAPLIENNKEDMYWWFGEHRYVIQGVPNFDKEQVLPLAIKTKEGGEFKIKIDATENWPSGKELYLKDKTIDTIHDILKKDYHGKIEKSGEITDRFELIFFKEKALDPLEPELPILEGIGISYSHFSRKLKISNENLLNVSRVMIFDMGGKLIQEYDGLPTEREILLGMRPVRSGIYIVKVFSENIVTDKKIIIK